MTDRDPSTEMWQQSTSSQLRQAQTALAASQADLTTAKADAAGARQALRNVLINLGLDVTDENLQPLMEAKRIRAEADQLRATPTDKEQ